MRLETLFDPPGSANPTRLGGRCPSGSTPDEASICRDDALVSPGELAAVTGVLAAVRLPGPFDGGWLDSDRPGGVASCARRVVPPRGRLAGAALPPQVDGDELTSSRCHRDMPPAALPNRVGGLPPRLQVWAVTGGWTTTRSSDPVVGRPRWTRRHDRRHRLDLPLPGRAAVARDALVGVVVDTAKGGAGRGVAARRRLIPDRWRRSASRAWVTSPRRPTSGPGLDGGELGLLALGSADEHGPRGTRRPG